MPTLTKSEIYKGPNAPATTVKTNGTISGALTDEDVARSTKI